MSRTPSSAGAASSIAVGLVEHARLTPDRVAVSDTEQSLTYADLDALVGTFAATLLDRCDGTPGAVPVPVLVGRDRWSVVAIHALFRAGIPFVPLDRTAPTAFVDDVRARVGPSPFVVATAADVNATVPPDRLVAVPRSPARTEPPRAVDPGAPATVVFTSGSSGHPKGVVLGWDNWDARLAESAANEARLPDGGAARTGLALPLQWVGGLGRIAAMGAGMAVVLPAGPFLAPESFVAWLATVDATHTNVVPSLFARSGDRWAGPPADELRSVHTGGEGVGWDLVRVLRGVAPAARITVQYSATESSGCIMSTVVEPTDPVGTGAFGLGRPVHRGRVRFEPVPGGDDGADGSGSIFEVVVAGTVAHGYWGDAEATAARFGADPDGTRWWRSGDLVRFDGSGQVVLAGRTDDVVKINGRLVAPAESERLLAGLPGIREAVVVPDRTGPRPRLVAHLTLDGSEPLTPEIVRAHCRARLAPGVVPAVLMRHEELPHTTSGKADRAALAATPVRPWRATPIREARPGAETELLAELCRITGIDDLGPDDDLVLSGLDSLAVVEFCAAAQDVLGRPFGLADLVEGASVAGLCRRAAPLRADGTTVVLFNPTGTHPPVFVVPPGGGGAWRFRSLGLALGHDRPLAVGEARGLRSGGRVDRSFAGQRDHVVREFERLAAPDAARVVVVGYSGSAPLAHAVAVRMDATGRPVHLVLLDAAPVPLANYEVARVRAAIDGRPAPPAFGRTGRRSLRRAAVRVRDEIRMRRPARTRSPGRGPEVETERSRAFSRAMTRAARGYVPPAVRFPVTAIRVEHGDVLDVAVRTIAPAATVVEVGGNHISMLDPPHVAEVAAVIVRVADEEPSR